LFFGVAGPLAIIELLLPLLLESNCYMYQVLGFMVRSAGPAGVEEPESTSWLVLRARTFAAFGFVSVSDRGQPETKAFVVSVLNLYNKTAIFVKLLFDSGSRDES
jgi:hypothetical protein